MKLDKSMFREYDIRGIALKELNIEAAYLIGRAFASKLNKLGFNKCVVGHDNRLSSEILESSLLKGLLDSGITVYRLGLVTTPMCYFASNYLSTKCRIMVTASHNPKEYNGFKFSYNGIHNAFGTSVRELYKIIEENDFIDGIGEIIDYDITDAYVKLITDKINLGKRKIKVVYDCGNGTTSVIIKKVFDELDIEAIPLYAISDGSFPNHHPDPSVEANLEDLKKNVILNSADLGIAFDGDGDRLGVVDEKGNFIPADKYLLIMWRYLANTNVKKEAFFDIKCSQVLPEELKKLNVRFDCTRTGASYTQKISFDGDYTLGGELAGHIYFRDKFPGYDDGIYNGIRLIERLSYTDKKLSELLDDIKLFYSTEELKMHVDDNIKFKIIDMIKEYCLQKKYEIVTIDGVKVYFEDGNALIRASNTGPNITMRYEATTKERFKEIQQEFSILLEDCLKKNDN